MIESLQSVTEQLTWAVNADDIKAPLYLKRIKTGGKFSILVEEEPCWKIKTRMATRNNWLGRGVVAPAHLRLSADPKEKGGTFFMQGTFTTNPVNRIEEVQPQTTGPTGMDEEEESFDFDG